MTKNLCRGFQTTRITEDAILDTYYAVLSNSVVLVSDEHKRSNSFSEGRKWAVSPNGRPEGAEFIGNYRAPSL